MDDTSGPGDGEGNLYQRQHLALASQLTEEANRVLGATSRASSSSARGPGPPTQPWLEPDVNDRIGSWRPRGAGTVVARPIGFVSDHMEVVYDLDTEAAGDRRAGRGPLRARADRRHRRRLRRATWSTPSLERAAEARGEVVPEFEGRMPSVCAPGCCPNLRQARPALCGSD